MPSAGYSGTPLIKKLGIGEKMKIRLISAPENYFELLEKNVQKQLSGKNETPDFVHLFARTNLDLVHVTAELKETLLANPIVIIWISWYKKSAGIPTDVTETDIRNYGLSIGLVDIKVCAISELWSGLKFVVPKSKR
jgi:hypothetical protein